MLDYRPTAWWLPLSEEPPITAKNLGQIIVMQMAAIHQRAVNHRYAFWDDLAEAGLASAGVRVWQSGLIGQLIESWTNVKAIFYGFVPCSGSIDLALEEPGRFRCIYPVGAEFGLTGEHIANRQSNRFGDRQATPRTRVGG